MFKFRYHRVRNNVAHIKLEKRGTYLPKPTPSMEDYMEIIYNLIKNKGYARVTDIAEALEVHPSSVTKVIQKIDKDDIVPDEKARGLGLADIVHEVGKTRGLRS